jgi:hypothetical protein
MGKFFDREVEQAVDTAARAASAISEAASSRLGLNIQIPGLAALIEGSRPAPGWSDQIEKLSIGSLDDVRLTVVAQYNPMTIQINKTVPWTEHNRLPAPRRPHDGDGDIEINATPTRTMSVELLFDGFEDHRSVQPELDKLEALSSFQNPRAQDPANRRPHHCVVAWGIAHTRPFPCVIKSLSTRLLMFAPSGAPLRATCTAELSEVHGLSRLRSEASTVGQKLKQLLAWKPDSR